MQELAEVLAVNFSATGEDSKLNEDWRWENQEQALLSACSSLITVVETQGSRIVQFSHFSVREFLTSNRFSASQADLSRYHHIRPESAHAIMARVCIGVLLRLENSIDEESMRKFPLARYAAVHLADHLEFENVMSHITDEIDDLLDTKKPHFAAWMSYRSETWRWEMHVGRLKPAPLYHTANLGFIGLVQHLVAKRPQDLANIGGGYGTPLHAALRGKRLRVLQVLLSHSVDVDVRDSDGRTPLHLAASDGLLEATQMLIDHRADTNARDNSGSAPLHQTVMGSYTILNDKKFGIMRLLLENGAKVNARNDAGSTALLLVANKGNLEATESLLKCGASVHVPNREGRTPLHCASRGGYPHIIRILLEYGADMDAQDNERATPLHLAARNGMIEAAQLLLRHRAVVHLQDCKGKTPLHFASEEGYVDITRVLLKCGANTDALDNNRFTPLHLATSAGMPEAVELLIEHGASIDVKSFDVLTPLHIASQYGHRTS